MMGHMGNGAHIFDILLTTWHFHTLLKLKPPQPVTGLFYNYCAFGATLCIRYILQCKIVLHVSISGTIVSKLCFNNQTYFSFNNLTNSSLNVKYY